MNFWTIINHILTRNYLINNICLATTKRLGTFSILSFSFAFSIRALKNNFHSIILFQSCAQTSRPAICFSSGTRVEYLQPSKAHKLGWFCLHSVSEDRKQKLFWSSSIKFPNLCWGSAHWNTRISLPLHFGKQVLIEKCFFVMRILCNQQNRYICSQRVRVLFVKYSKVDGLPKFHSPLNRSALQHLTVGFLVSRDKRPFTIRNCFFHIWGILLIFPTGRPFHFSMIFCLCATIKAFN